MSDPVTLKYIRHSVAGFIVWPKALECLSHRDVARVYGFSREVCHGEIMSAGFIDFNGGNSKPFCYGRSESLNINSMAADTAALRAEWGMVCRTCSGRGVIGGFEHSAAPGYVTEDCPDCNPRAPLTPSLQAQAQAVGAFGDADSLEPSEPVL